MARNAHSATNKPTPLPLFGISNLYEYQVEDISTRLSYLKFLIIQDK